MMLLVVVISGILSGIMFESEAFARVHVSTRNSHKLPPLASVEKPTQTPNIDFSLPPIKDTQISQPHIEPPEGLEISETLFDEATGISVSGWVAVDASLSMLAVDSALHEESSCEACLDIRKKREETSGTFCIYRIDIEGMHDLTLDGAFDVGDGFTFKRVSTYHCEDGVLIAASPRIGDNNKLIVSFHPGKPFAIVLPEEEPEDEPEPKDEPEDEPEETTKEKPKEYSFIFVLIIMLLAVGGRVYFFYKERQKQV